MTRWIQEYPTKYAKKILRNEDGKEEPEKSY